MELNNSYLYDEIQDIRLGMTIHSGQFNTNRYVAAEKEERIEGQGYN